MKRWLVTGASSGFGRMLVERASSDGDAVIAIARRADHMATLSKLRGVTSMVLDVTAPDAGPRITEAIDTLGGLDVLINNAGYGLFGSVESIPDGEVRALFDVNLFAALTVVRAALPSIRASKGRVIQMSSLLGIAVWPSSGIYAASKAALELASEAMANELAPTGVRVTIVEPGVFDTEFGASAKQVVHDDVSGPTIGRLRAQIAGADVLTLGDPANVVQAIMTVIAHHDPPLRLAVGSDAVRDIRAALESRLAELARFESISVQVGAPSTGMDAPD